jgi:hypothetical protein
LRAFKVGREWRFSIQQIDELRLSRESLGPRQEVRVDPEKKARIRRSDSLPHGSAEAESKDLETKVMVADLGEAPKSLNARFSDSPSTDAGLEESELSHSHWLGEENCLLKGIVADQALEIRVLKEALPRKD